MKRFPFAAQKIIAGSSGEEFEVLRQVGSCPSDEQKEHKQNEDNYLHVNM